MARKTGSLADIIQDHAVPEGRGFVFDDATPRVLSLFVRRAFAAYGTPREETLQRRGMAADFSWGASAKQYAIALRRDHRG